MASLTAPRRRLLPALALLLVLTAPARAEAAGSTFPFTLGGYANNVKVLPPLVGDHQLGMAKIGGSGVAASTSTTGIFEVSTAPLLPRYQPRWLKGTVVTWAYKEVNYAHGAGYQRTLTLTVQITSSSHPKEECAPGTKGTLVLVDDTKGLPNGRVADSITLGKWTATCNTFVMGWSNADGGARTKPAFGGPGGGQWANVQVNKR